MSSENPYRPPQSDVNAEREQRNPRPPQVQRAIWLLWASIALGLPLVMVQESQGDGMGLGTLIFVLLFTGIGAWLVLQISKGVNWVRHVYCGLFVFSMFVVFADITAMMQRSVIEVLLNLLNLAMDGVAMFWLYTGAGAAWFRAKR